MRVFTLSQSHPGLFRYKSRATAELLSQDIGGHSNEQAILAGHQFHCISLNHKTLRSGNKPVARRVKSKPASFKLEVVLEQPTQLGRDSSVHVESAQFLTIFWCSAPSKVRDDDGQQIWMKIVQQIGQNREGGRTLD